MTQRQVDHAVARATGESLSTIRHLGFTEQTEGPLDVERRPLVLDWDGADGFGLSYFPERS